MKKFILSFVLAFLTNSTFSQITLTSTVTNVSCFGGSNGSASVTATGGTGSYTYTWTPTNTNFNSITGLAAGAYTVNVEDAVANMSSLVINITEPPMLTAVTSATNSSCGQANGNTCAIVTGGIGALSYQWSNGVNTLCNSNIIAGAYTFTVTDSNGCIANASGLVNDIAGPVVSITSQTNTTCGGVCDGAASAMITGGNGPFTFQWIPTGGNGVFAQNLCAGNYIFQTTDSNGCMATSSVNILNNGGSASLPNATITTTLYNETCYLTGDGAIDLTITGTNPGPFTYQWSNGATTQDITNLTSNLYWVTITDGSSNCMTIMDTVIYVGTNCGTIQGNVFVDNNSDCIKNVGDNNYNGVSIIVNPGNRYGYTNINGDYNVNNLPYGTYSIALVNSGAIFPTCTTTLNTTVNAGTPNSVNNNLSVGFNSIVQPDLTVNAGSQGIIPGFVCRVNYYLNNLNNVGASGVYKATLPSAFIPNITNAFPSTYTLSGDTIIWNFNNVIYFSATTLFYIDFTVPLSTPLGSLFTTCMWAQPTITDLNYANNTYCYSRTVTGSYDPNDKTVSPVGVGIDGYILATETELTYLIRFQNTGNGPAVNIMVKDTLSPNVDITTFEMLSASHTYRMDILEGNVLRWRFNNIMLADSNSNEPASHGYIQYRIKRTSNNTPGTRIKNTAYIYFDFNEPVVTNTAINTIETVTGIKSQSSTDNEWNVYPNPNNGNFTISTSNSTLNKVIIYNVLGKKVQEINANENKTLQINLHNKGVYFIELTDNSGNTRTEKIIVN